MLILTTYPNLRNLYPEKNFLLLTFIFEELLRT